MPQERCITSSRGIERRKIFYDTKDGDDFLDRLGEIVGQSEMRCYPWALIPNHFHLLLKTAKAHSLLCFLARRELGMSLTALAHRLGISVPTASVAAQERSKSPIVKSWRYQPF